MRKQDFDRQVASHESNRRGSGMKYVLVAVVSVLATLGLVTCGFLLYRLLGAQQAIAPSNQINGSNSTTVNPSTPATTANLGIQPGQFVQPAFANKAQVELTAVRRIPGTTDEVSVEMRMNRLADDAGGGDIINVGSTTARNPITNETYQAVDFLKRSSGTVSLYQMRRGEPVEGYVVLKVPQGVNTIDIYVDQTQPFKNVAIAEANQAASSVNNSPVSPTSNTSSAPASPSTPEVSSGAISSSVTSSNISSAQNPSASTAIQPGQFVQNALGNKAQVELLSVKRIQDPELKTRDVVNVQMRIRRIESERVTGSDMINIGSTTARNPDTSETYKAINFIDRSTGVVSLYSMRPRSSADAYVWLRVPEGANTLDIYIENTQAFKNVPISN